MVLNGPGDGAVDGLSPDAQRGNEISVPGLHSTREQAEGLRSLGCPKPNLQVELSDFLQEIRVLKAQGTANSLGKSLTPRPNGPS